MSTKNPEKPRRKKILIWIIIVYGIIFATIAGVFITLEIHAISTGFTTGALITPFAALVPLAFIAISFMAVYRQCDEHAGTHDYFKYHQEDDSTEVLMQDLTASRPISSKTDSTVQQNSLELNNPPKKKGKK